MPYVGGRPDADENEPNIARAGTVWMCGACGKTHKDRDQFSDSSCRTWAVLVHEASIIRDESGRAIGADAVNDPEAELTW
jgi:hypothetical protein